MMSSVADDFLEGGDYLVDAVPSVYDGWGLHGY